MSVTVIAVVSAQEPKRWESWGVSAMAPTSQKKEKVSLESWHGSSCDTPFITWPWMAVKIKAPAWRLGAINITVACVQVKQHQQTKAQSGHTHFKWDIQQSISNNWFLYFPHFYGLRFNVGVRSCRAPKCPNIFFCIFFYCRHSTLFMFGLHSIYFCSILLQLEFEVRPNGPSKRQRSFSTE